MVGQGPGPQAEQPLALVGAGQGPARLVSLPADTAAARLTDAEVTDFVRDLIAVIQPRPGVTASRSGIPYTTFVDANQVGPEADLAGAGCLRSG